LFQRPECDIGDQANAPRIGAHQPYLLKSAAQKTQEEGTEQTAAGPSNQRQQQLLYGDSSKIRRQQRAEQE
jgi:hypothetical protein